jgi:hypothetical protein
LTSTSALSAYAYVALHRGGRERPRPSCAHVLRLLL